MVAPAAVDNGIIQDILIKGEEEKAMVNSAKQVFIEKGNPPPEREFATFGAIVKIYGLESIFQFVSLLGSAWVSSLRVGILMEITQLNLIAKYLADNVQIGLFGSAESMRWAAMLAFEGALLAGGFYTGTRLAQKKHSSLVEWTALAVTVIGGGLSSLTLVDSGQQLTSFIAWVFAAVSSVGAPFIVLFMAQNMGFLWKEIINLQDKFDAEYESKLSAWSKGFDEEYKYIAAQLFGEERRKKLGKFQDGNEIPGAPQTPKIVKRSVTDTVRKFLIANGLLPSQIGDGPQFRFKPSDVADQLDLQGTDRTNIHTILTRLRSEETRGTFGK